MRNERGREGPNDEGTKGTGERDGTVTRIFRHSLRSFVSLSPTVPFLSPLVSLLRPSVVSSLRPPDETSEVEDVRRSVTSGGRWTRREVDKGRG